MGTDSASWWVPPGDGDIPPERDELEETGPDRLDDAWYTNWVASLDYPPVQTGEPVMEGQLSLDDLPRRRDQVERDWFEVRDGEWGPAL